MDPTLICHYLVFKDQENKENYYKKIYYRKTFIILILFILSRKITL